MGNESTMGMAARVQAHKNGLVILRDGDHGAFVSFWLVEMNGRDLESWWRSIESFSSFSGSPVELLFCEIFQEPVPPIRKGPVIPGHMLTAGNEEEVRFWMDLWDTHRYYSCVLCCDSDSHLEAPEGRRIYHRGYDGERKPALGLRESPFLPPDLGTFAYVHRRIARRALEDPPAVDLGLLTSLATLKRGSRYRPANADQFLAELKALDADPTKSLSEALAWFIVQAMGCSISNANLLVNTVGNDDPKRGWQYKRQLIYRYVLVHANVLGFLSPLKQALNQKLLFTDGGLGGSNRL